MKAEGKQRQEEKRKGKRQVRRRRQNSGNGRDRTEVSKPKRRIREIQLTESSGQITTHPNRPNRSHWPLFFPSESLCSHDPRLQRSKAGHPVQLCEAKTEVCKNHHCGKTGRQVTAGLWSLLILSYNSSPRRKLNSYLWLESGIYFRVTKSCAAK